MIGERGEGERREKGERGEGRGERGEGRGERGEGRGDIPDKLSRFEYIKHSTMWLIKRNCMNALPSV